MVPILRHRKFLRACAIGVLLLGSVSCAGNAADTGSSQTESSISIGVPNAVTSLDPAAGTAGGDYPILYMIYDRLINTDPKTAEPQPGLAASWKYQDAAKTKLQLNLRDNATFQDGTAIDGRAVAASIKHYQETGVQTDLSDVESVDVVGKHEIVLNLKGANSAILGILSDRAGMIVSPAALKKYGKDYAAHPVGAGPYAFKSQVTGSEIDLSGYKGYWSGTPKLSTVKFMIVSNPTTLENSLRSNQIDMAMRFPAKDGKALRANKNLTVSADPSLAFMRIFLDTSHPPFDDARVRQAINYAVNRANLVKIVNGGIGYPVTGPFPPGTPYVSKDDPPTYPFDPAKAKSLLAAAGHSDGLTITCLSSHGQGYDAASPLLVSDLKAVGVTLKITEVSLTQQHDDFPKGKADCSFSSWTGRADPYMTIDGMYAKDGTYNYFKTDFGLDKLIAKLKATDDPAARLALIKKIQGAPLAAAAPGVPLISQPLMVAYRDGVTGYQPNIAGKPDLRGISVTK